MPRIVNIVPKDIYLLIEFRLDEFKKIKLAMDRSKVNASNDEEKQAMDYFSKEFYTFICDAIEEIEGRKDGS